MTLCDNCNFYSVYKLVSPSHITCEGTVESESSSSDSAKIDTPAVKLFHNSLEPIRLDVHCNMVDKQEEENASKQGQYGTKRKRKNPPR